MVIYKHSLNIGLARGLRSILKTGGGPINLKHVPMTRNQWNNFQKLRYWHFVEQVAVDGHRKAGVWEITDLGRAFIFNEIAAPFSVWTYRGEVCAMPEDEKVPRQVRVIDIVDWYEKREDYAANATPFTPPPPPNPDDDYPQPPFV